MSAKEKTYTFRAPGDLAARTRRAFRTWDDLLAKDDAVSGEALREAMTTFCLALGRRAREFENSGNQSELFRSMFELFADATEKAVADIEFVRAYEAWAQEDREGRRLRKAALAAAADRWRDE
jgi:hypothetical protein